jgi:ATP-dependent RNA helicase SUPV3L1/SUV3
VEAVVERGLRPLLALREAPLQGAARGLAFTLVEGLGTVPRRAVSAQVRALATGDRRQLSRLGVTFGRQGVFLAALLRPEAIRVRVVLAGARYGAPKGPLPDGGPSRPASSLGDAFEAACGYLPAGPRLIRADLLDRFAADMARAAAGGPFRPDPASAGRLGCPLEEVAGVLRALGYVERGGGFFSVRQRERRGPLRNVSR